MHQCTRIKRVVVALANKAVMTNDSASASASKGPRILAIIWSGAAVSSLFVAARLVSRRILHRRVVMLDDFFILAALFCMYLATSFTTVSVAYGLGRHYATLTSEQASVVKLWSISSFPPSVLSFGLPKLAVIVLLTRLLFPSRFHRWLLWAMGIACQLSLVVSFLITLGSCGPPRALWDFSVAGHCTTTSSFDNRLTAGYSTFVGAFSAFVDLYLAVYPAVVLCQLQMPWKKKVALSGALGFGAVSCAVAVYKVTLLSTLRDPDFSCECTTFRPAPLVRLANVAADNAAEVILWTMCETTAIIIAATIPTLQPLFLRIARRRRFKRADPKGGGDEPPQPHIRNRPSEGPPTIGSPQMAHTKPQFDPLLTSSLNATIMGDLDAELGGPCGNDSGDRGCADAVVADGAGDVGTGKQQPAQLGPGRCEPSEEEQDSSTALEKKGVRGEERRAGEESGDASSHCVL